MIIIFAPQANTVRGSLLAQTRPYPSDQAPTSSHYIQERKPLPASSRRHRPSREASTQQGREAGQPEATSLREWMIGLIIPQQYVQIYLLFLIIAKLSN